MTYTNTIKVLEEFAEYIIKNYREDLKQNRPGKSYNAIATGDLYNNISTEVQYNNKRFEVSIELEEYWQYVEDGRRGNSKKPPYNAILNWVKRKPVIPYPKNGKLPTEEQLAFIIQRSIAKKGIPATNYMQNSIDDALRLFEVRIKEALILDFKEVMIGEITVRLNKK